MSKAEQATAAWNGSPPDWVMALARTVDGEGNQNQVARRIGYSASAIVGVIKNSYGADMAGIERAVRAKLMAETVTCPVLGEMPLARCIDQQGRPLDTSNPVSVRLYRACRSGCPHSHLKAERQSRSALAWKGNQC